LLGHPHRHLDQLGNEMIDTLACHLCFLAVLLAEGLGLGDSFLQRRDVGLQSLERTAFVRVFVRVFVRAPTRRVSGFLGFEIDKDPSLAVVAPLPLPACTDSLLARGFRRDAESLGKLAKLSFVLRSMTSSVKLLSSELSLPPPTTSNSVNSSGRQSDGGGGISRPSKRCPLSTQ
jgi:hypothetical protein